MIKFIVIDMLIYCVSFYCFVAAVAWPEEGAGVQAGRGRKRRRLGHC